MGKDEFEIRFTKFEKTLCASTTKGELVRKLIHYLSSPEVIEQAEMMVWTLENGRFVVEGYYRQADAVYDAVSTKDEDERWENRVNGIMHRHIFPKVMGEHCSLFDPFSLMAPKFSCLYTVAAKTCSYGGKVIAVIILFRRLEPELEWLGSRDAQILSRVEEIFSNLLAHLEPAKPGEESAKEASKKKGEKTAKPDPDDWWERGEPNPY